MSLLSDIAPWLVLAGGLAYGLILALWARARLAAGIIGQFLGMIFLPLMLVLLGVVMLVEPALQAVDSRVLQAAIAGLVIAMGWLTTAIFSELERKRSRDERLRDYHKALYAEIGSTLVSLYADGQAQRYADEIVARMEAEPAFVPFIPKESHDRVFSAVLDKIEILPRQTIDAVIAYYEVLSMMKGLAADMRGAAFSALEPGRRIAMYRDYFDARMHAFRLGQYTLGLINAYSKGGPSGADTFANRFSNRDVGQRPPSGESV